jgi:hypothetical protein
MNIKRACLLLCLIFCCGHLLAQNAGQQQLINNAALEYLRLAGSQSPIYYGRKQELLSPAINHPYLKDWLFVNARLSYSGIIYPDALLRMDLSRDELIVISPAFHEIVLFPEKVDFAELQGYTIIYFRRDSLPGSPSTGYYFLLHSRECKVLKKQSSVLMFNTSTGERYYQESTNYYLYKDGVYYTIRNKRGLLNVLQPYKRELKRFISTNNLRFRRDAEELITRTVVEYEKLSGVQ